MPPQIPAEDLSQLTDLYQALPEDHPVKGKLQGFLQKQQGQNMSQVAAIPTPLPTSTPSFGPTPIDLGPAPQRQGAWVPSGAKVAASMGYPAPATPGGALPKLGSQMDVQMAMDPNQAFTGGLLQDVRKVTGTPAYLGGQRLLGEDNPALQQVIPQLRQGRVAGAAASTGEGLFEAATPLMIAAGLRAPALTARALMVAEMGSEASGFVARHAGASPDMERLARVAGAFAGGMGEGMHARVGEVKGRILDDVTSGLRKADPSLDPEAAKLMAQEAYQKYLATGNAKYIGGADKEVGALRALFSRSGQSAVAAAQGAVSASPDVRTPADEGRSPNVSVPSQPQAPASPQPEPATVQASQESLRVSPAGTATEAVQQSAAQGTQKINFEAEQAQWTQDLKNTAHKDLTDRLQKAVDQGAISPGTASRMLQDRIQAEKEVTAEEAALPPEAKSPDTRKWYTYDESSQKGVESTGPKVGTPPKAGDTVTDPFGRPATFVEAPTAALNEVERAQYLDKQGHEPVVTSEQKDNITPAPGARSAFTGDENAPKDIIELTKKIQEAIPPGTLGERIASALNVGEYLRQTKKQTHLRVDMAEASIHRLYDGLNAWWTAYKTPVKYTDYETATGKWSGAENLFAWELDKFTDQIKKSIPNSLDREALANWIEADGDKNLLKERMEKSSDIWKDGYRRAINLTAQQQEVGNLIRGRNKAALDEAIDSGILSHGVENYIQHIYSGDLRAQRKLQAQVNWTSLTKNPSFASKRHIPTYFDAEQLGLTPKNKDVGFLTAMHERALREAIAARSYVRSLQEGKATDGRPLVVLENATAREINPKEEDIAEAYLLRSGGKPLTDAGKDALKTLREIRAQALLDGSSNIRTLDKAITKILQDPQYNTKDYMPIDHPSLRGWKWAGETTSGEPVFLQGDALVHPEVARKVRNNLSKSTISTYTIPGTEIRPGSVALRISSEVKSAILSFSGFHQTTLGIHAMEHRVRPFGLEELDLNDPIQRKLVDHGLMVAHYDAAAAFGEGLQSGGMISMMAPYYRTYTDYLFKRALPKYKMAMAKDALARNTKRYGDKLSEDQILALTAKQSNAAFGGLNYKMLGRNKTFQDSLRLMLMAPDFTEARLRFVGQAFKPGGREQMIALALGAGVLYGMGRILNQISDGNPHWDKPFSLVHGNKEYALRTIQGDMYNAATHPGDYLHNRLNPLVNLSLQMFEGRNAFGDKTDQMELIKNAAKSDVPIPAQPWFRDTDDPKAVKIASSLYKMIGVNVKNFRTDTENFTAERSSSVYQMQMNVKREKVVRQLAQQFKDKQINPGGLQELVNKNLISPSMRDKVLDNWEDLTAPGTKLQRQYKRLFPEDALTAYEKATPAERTVLLPMLQDHMDNLEQYTPEEQQSLRQRYFKLIKKP